MAYINIMFETHTGRMISGVLPSNFELTDMQKLVRDKVDDDNPIENMRFICKNKQLILNDAAAFAHQKALITNNVTIRVAKRMIGGYPSINALLEKLEIDAGTAIEALSKRANTTCPICLTEKCTVYSFNCNLCSKVNTVCKTCFLKIFRMNDLNFKCLSCKQNINNENLFASSATILQSIQMLTNVREMKCNIDCQICECGDFQVNDTLFSKQFCPKCQRWYCFFCNKTWNNASMTDDKYTCHDNCDYENRISFEMIDINPAFASPTLKSLPNRRCCPKCFQVGAYGNKCQNHTCLNCNHVFCFICLRDPATCNSDRGHCMPIRIQTYSIFPNSTNA